jgi:hypothetical protein
VEVPLYLRSPGVRTEVAVVLTARRPAPIANGSSPARGALGDPALVTVSACRVDTSAASAGRPLVGRCRLTLSSPR